MIVAQDAFGCAPQSFDCGVPGGTYADMISSASPPSPAAAPLIQVVAPPPVQPPNPTLEPNPDPYLPYPLSPTPHPYLLTPLPTPHPTSCR